MLIQARKRVADLQAYQAQIVKAWIEERITKAIYDDKMRTVGTQLEAAGLSEGEAVMELAELCRLDAGISRWCLGHCLF